MGFVPKSKVAGGDDDWTPKWHTRPQQMTLSHSARNQGKEIRPNDVRGQLLVQMVQMRHGEAVIIVLE